MKKQITEKSKISNKITAGVSLIAHNHRSRWIIRDLSGETLTNLIKFVNPKRELVNKSWGTLDLEIPTDRLKNLTESNQPV